ncbi:hypothetical protein GUJ93_ZPchr0003g17007 [Zizania palustris]|uniref:Uncharacterized protein n=1 Tax=Zizania palustris TaxID=103762 RepID=A0A8J5V5L5_ZIZPA|nr:hypothetical protein GUJ93_ZPchr0003g17007 [Zizania palustris]
MSEERRSREDARGREEREPRGAGARERVRREGRVDGWSARKGATRDVRCAWKACGVEVGAAAWGEGGGRCGRPEMARAAERRGRRKREVGGGGAMGIMHKRHYPSRKAERYNS